MSAPAIYVVGSLVPLVLTIWAAWIGEHAPAPLKRRKPPPRRLSWEDRLSAEVEALLIALGHVVLRFAPDHRRPRRRRDRV